MINCPKCQTPFSERRRRFCPSCGEPTEEEKKKIANNEKLRIRASNLKNTFFSKLIPLATKFAKRNQEASIAIVIAALFLGWSGIGTIKNALNHSANRTFCTNEISFLRSSYYSSKETYDRAIRYDASDQRRDRLYNDMDKKRDLLKVCEKILGLD